MYEFTTNFKNKVELTKLHQIQSRGCVIKCLCHTSNTSLVGRWPAMMTGGAHRKAKAIGKFLQAFTRTSGEESSMSWI